MPTAMIRLAPRTSASSSATSSLVPEADERLVPDAEPVEPVAADRATGAVGVQHDLPGRRAGALSETVLPRVPAGAALGQPVLADHDDVGPVAGRDQGVGAGVHADQHRVAARG